MNFNSVHNRKRRGCTLLYSPAALCITTFPTMPCCATATCHCCRSPPASTRGELLQHPCAGTGGSHRKEKTTKIYPYKYNREGGRKICNRCIGFSASAACDAGREIWETGFCAAPLSRSTERHVERDQPDYFPPRCEGVNAQDTR